MLANHLDPEGNRASYRIDTIEQVVSWLDSKLALSGKRVCDLGCGPGLYALRFAAVGSEVVGVDFSQHALSYADGQAQDQKLAIQYLHANYLVDQLPTGFDVVTLIYTDLCVLSPEQRHSLLRRMHHMLNPGGRIVLDVATQSAFSALRESVRIEDRLMNGFWALGPYVGVRQVFLYPDDHVSLDRYLIAEPNDSWEIYNWFQHYSPASLTAELQAAGFSVDTLVGSLTGDALAIDSECIGVIASQV